MNLFEIIIISLALSLGVFKVLMNAAVVHCYNPPERFRIALVFALFKSLLLLLGYWITGLFSSMIMDSSYIIMISIFLVLGIKMIFDAIRLKAGERTFQLNNFMVLVLAAIAANIDGFIAGIAFAFSGAEILFMASTLFLFSIFVSWNALIYGEKSGNFVMASRVNIAGGMVLTAYALYLFFENTSGLI